MTFVLVNFIIEYITFKISINDKKDNKFEKLNKFLNTSVKKVYCL